MEVKREPLAYRMMPRTLEQFFGQENIVGEGKLLNRMIRADRISSVIFYGPPGTGKTSLAKIIASSTKANFQKLNAVTSGIADIKRIVSDTQSRIINPQGRTVLFIDEIHRFNKAQQDALLPYVEDGTIILIGATTENPYFEVNKALISRSSIFMLKPLNKNAVKSILKNALNDKERGLGELDIEVEEGVLDYLADICNGDARAALNSLEIAVLTSPLGKEGKLNISLELIGECSQKKLIRYDKSGEEHYDNISAFIKSMRGSCPNAAIFYLARALDAGEDPMFMARRIIICASEDVGMANPGALRLAVAAAQAVHMVGMPEARIILSQAAIMVATSPKSNSCYVAIDKASRDIASKKTGEVPMHLRNAVMDGMGDLGYGKGYKYPHDYRGNYTEQDYLPKEIRDKIYYEPTDNGYEARIKEWLQKKKNMGET